MVNRFERPIYKRDPLPGETSNPVTGKAESPAMMSLPLDSYHAARTRQEAIDAEDARSAEVLTKIREQRNSRPSVTRTISPDFQPSGRRPAQVTPGWQKAEAESSVHPVAAALEAEHQKNGITDPSKRVQQFSLMYPHVTGANAVDAQKKHADLLRNTLNTIQEASTRAGDTRTPAIHTTAIRDAEHAIWQKAAPKPSTTGFDIDEYNRQRKQKQEQNVANAVEDIRPVYADHASANPTLHPAHVGDIVLANLAKRGISSPAHDSAVFQLNEELKSKVLDNPSDPRMPAVKAAVGRAPAPRTKPIDEARLSESEPDKNVEYDEPSAAAPKAAPVPRSERVTKKQLNAHAQKLVFHHWVGDNPRPADVSHADHWNGFKSTEEAKHPMVYLKYKLGIADPEAHVKRSIIVSRTPEAEEAGPAARESKPLDMSGMKDIPGRRPKVNAFVKAPLSAARPGMQETKATRQAAFESGAGRGA